MYEIQPGLASRRPATVVDTRPVLTLTAPYHARADLVAEIHRQARRGQIRPLAAQPLYNERTGRWEHRVLQLRPPAPAWIRPAIITGFVLIALAALGLLAVWVVSTLASAPLALLLLASLAVLAILTRAGKRQTVNIINNVSQR